MREEGDRSVHYWLALRTPTQVDEVARAVIRCMFRGALSIREATEALRNLRTSRDRLVQAATEN